MGGIKSILQRSRHHLRTDIIKVFSFTAMSTVVKMITGFISIKVVAVLIGPTGVALLGQLNNFSSISMTVASGGINNGITKYVAEYKESPRKLKLFLSTALQVTVILSIVSGILLISFSSYLSRTIFLDSTFSYVFIVFGFTIILYTLNGYLMSILNGFKEFQKFVRISIITSILGLFFTIGLVFFWNLKGALISAVTYQSLAFFITLQMVIKLPWFTYENFIGRFSRIAVKKFFNFSIMTLVSAITVPVSQMYIRGYIIANLSPTQAGWWEGMNRISGMYLLVITSSFGVYYLPQLSSLKDKNDLKNEVINAYKIIIPALLICSSGIYFLRDFIIRILFSAEFYPMRDLFAWQLIGDLFKISTWLIGFTLVAKSLTKIYVFNEVSFSLLFILLAIFLSKHYGLTGITIAYMFNYIIAFAFMIFVFNKIIIKTK